MDWWRPPVHGPAKILNLEPNFRQKLHNWQGRLSSFWTLLNPAKLPTGFGRFGDTAEPRLTPHVLCTECHCIACNIYYVPCTLQGVAHRPTQRKRKDRAHHRGTCTMSQDGQFDRSPTLVSNTRLYTMLMILAKVVYNDTIMSISLMEPMSVLR